MKDFTKQQEHEKLKFEEKQRLEKLAFEAKQQQARQREEWRQAERKRQEEFEDRLVSSITSGLYCFSKKQAEMIFNKAWEDGHSCGYQEVENHFNDLTDWCADFLAAAY